MLASLEADVLQSSFMLFIHVVTPQVLNSARLTCTYCPRAGGKFHDRRAEALPCWMQTPKMSNLSARASNKNRFEIHRVLLDKVRKTTNLMREFTLGLHG